MNLSFLDAVRAGRKSQRAGLSGDRPIEQDPLPALARLIYQEMNVQPRQMHVAIEIAKEQLSGIRQLLMQRGLRQPGADGAGDE